MEMDFAAKVHIDTRSSGNSIRKGKGGGRYAENYKLAVIYRNGLVDKKRTEVVKKLTVWKIYTLSDSILFRFINPSLLTKNLS